MPPQLGVLTATVEATGTPPVFLRNSTQAAAREIEPSGKRTWRALSELRGSCFTQTAVPAASNSRKSSSPACHATIDGMSDVSVIVTGIVGVLGIAGTLFTRWQTNRSQTANLIRNFEAQRDEARRADKLALYATYLARADA